MGLRGSFLQLRAEFALVALTCPLSKTTVQLVRHQCRASSTHTNSCVRNCVTLADPRGSGVHAPKRFANKTHFRTNWPSTPQVVITQKGLRLQLQGASLPDQGLCPGPRWGSAFRLPLQVPALRSQYGPSSDTGIARICSRGHGRVAHGFRSSW